MKILFVDVDGTLVDYDGTVQESAILALKQAKKNGHMVFLCTGRNLTELRKEILDIPKDGLICANGAFVTIGDKILHESYFDKEELREICGWLENNKIAYYLASNDALFASENYEEIAERYIPHLKPLHTEVLKEARKDINKVSMILTEKKEHLLAEEKWKEYQVSPRGMEGERYLFCDIRLKKVNKKEAVKMILEELKIPKGDAIAFGDGMIDIPLFEECGSAVAMGNAYEEVKMAADYVTSDVNDDGVYAAFRYLNLIEEEQDD